MNERVILTCKTRHARRSSLSHTVLLSDNIIPFILKHSNAGVTNSSCDFPFISQRMLSLSLTFADHLEQSH